MENYQISLNPTDLPAGYLSDIDYDELEVKRQQNFKNYLNLNGFTLITPLKFILNTVLYLIMEACLLYLLVCLSQSTIS